MYICTYVRTYVYAGVHLLNVDARGHFGSSPLLAHLLLDAGRSLAMPTVRMSSRLGRLRRRLRRLQRLLDDVEVDPGVFGKASLSDKKRLTFIKRCFEVNPEVLDWVDDAILIKNKRFSKDLCRYNMEALCWFPSELTEDADFMTELMSVDPDAVVYYTKGALHDMLSFMRQGFRRMADTSRGMLADVGPLPIVPQPHCFE